MLRRMVFVVLLLSLPLIACGGESKTDKPVKPQGLVRIAHPRIVDDYGPLFMAVEGEDLDHVKKKVSKDPSLLNVVTRSGRLTLLHKAAATHNEAMVAWLISKGMSPNLADGRGAVPLTYANYPGMVRLLISKHANPGLQDVDGRTPLFFAALNTALGRHSNVPFTEYEGLMGVGKQKLTREAGFWVSAFVTPMLASKVVINTKDKFGRTVLHYMVGSGDITMSLYEEQLKGPGDGGVSVVYTSLPVGLAVARLLVEHGADVNVTDKNGCTPLHYVDSKDAAELLLSKGAKVNAIDSRGATPLHYVVRMANTSGNDDPNLLDYLLSKGADVNARDKDDRTPLYYASKLEATHSTQGSAFVKTLSRHGGKL